MQKVELFYLAFLPSSSSLSSSSFFFLLFSTLLIGHRVTIWFTVLASDCGARYGSFIPASAGLWKQVLSLLCLLSGMNGSEQECFPDGRWRVSLDLLTFAVLNLQACHVKGRVTPSASQPAVCIYAQALLRSWIACQVICCEIHYEKHPETDAWFEVL